MIKIEKMSFGYVRKTVFRDLNINLSEGSIYGLLGKNGSGKSTLLKLITGLLFPLSGTIRTLEHDPAKRQPSFLSDVFILPEEFDTPRISVGDYARYYGQFYPRFSVTQMEELLKIMEVDSAHLMNAMSFGQKKKAMIAFALACNTRLLLMDEPTNGLDIPSKSSFRKVVASVASDERTIIISTHQVRDLDQLIDRVVILEDSEMLLNASINQITDKLLFTHLDPSEEALYAEQTIHGRWGVKLNAEHRDSQMDMELLFNTVVTNRQTIKQIFQNEQ